MQEVKELDEKLERFAQRFAAHKEKEDASFSIDAELVKLLPASGNVLDYVFGSPERQEGETFKQYKFRQKVDSYILRMRLKEGIKIVSRDGKQYIDPAKQQRKTHSKMIGIVKKGALRDHKKRTGQRMIDAEVKEYFAEFNV